VTGSYLTFLDPSLKDSEQEVETMWKCGVIVLTLLMVTLCLSPRVIEADESVPVETGPEGVLNAAVDNDLGKFAEGSRTDDETIAKEEEAIKLDGLNVSEIKELRDKAEKFAFQAEVNRMMKLIINSLYKNKEIFLRELISNASDALDKIRFMSLTDQEVMKANPEMSIKIKADTENKILHVTDTGIGMTKKDLIDKLGTIAKSGTSEFFNKVAEGGSTDSVSDLIGQFGVGFYSTFLIADRVVVTSKNNEDKQHIWESDAASFSVAEDPRGDTLGRGTTVSLYLKEEAHEFLEPNTIKELVKKYSQFINFNIYLWTSKTETVEEPEEEDEADKEDEGEVEGEDDAKVEEEKEEKKTKKVEKTVWDWELMNDTKPLWQRKPAEVEDKEYEDFYKSFAKDSSKPLAKTHFVAEGEVTFKSILFVPETAPHNLFNDYGSKTSHIKMFVRRVFITDDFTEMMPKYLNFVKGVVDSDDLPLNVSRETLQQNKLLKVIKKKLVRKALDMIKKLKDSNKEEFDKFWKEYSTNIKLGIMEDSTNRTRIAKLVRFLSSNSETESTTLEEYVERMKEGQTHIYFVGASSKAEAVKSPFVERLLKKGYEVLYLVEPIDEYCIQSLPEFDGKKFQNVAKEGVEIDSTEDAKKKNEEMAKDLEPLTNWLKEDALKDKIEKAVVSQRLSGTPAALVASQYGWSGNMERIMKAQAYKKSEDTMNSFYATQKKTLEINPRHPLIRELNARVTKNKEDQTTKDLANVLFETATLRSGYNLGETAEFAERIERMLRLSLDVPLDAKVEEEPEPEPAPAAEADEEEVAAEGEDKVEGEEAADHDEL